MTKRFLCFETRCLDILYFIGDFKIIIGFEFFFKKKKFKYMLFDLRHFFKKYKKKYKFFIPVVKKIFSFANRQNINAKPLNFNFNKKKIKKKKIFWKFFYLKKIQNY